MKRDSFVFYTSWIKGLEDWDEKDQAAAVFAMMRYAAYGEEPKTDNPVVKMAFTYAKPQIDTNNKRYLASKKGGAPKGNHNNPQGRGVSNHRLDNNQPNVDEDANDDANENDDVYAYKNEKETREDELESTDSCPPPFEKVKRLLEVNTLRIDPWKVYKHFENMGWKIDGEQIDDWQMAVINFAERSLGVVL